MLIINKHALQKSAKMVKAFVQCSTVQTTSLCYPHYIVLLRFLMTVKSFIWPLKSSQFLYLSGTINRNSTMNSGANELQIGQLLLRCVTDGTSSSAMLLTGLGPTLCSSDVIIFIDIANIVATVCHAIRYGNESYKIWLTVGGVA